LYSFQFLSSSFATHAKNARYFPRSHIFAMFAKKKELYMAQRWHFNVDCKL